MLSFGNNSWACALICCSSVLTNQFYVFQMDITDENPNGLGYGNGMWKYDYPVQPAKYLDRPASRVVLKTKFRWTPITSTIEMSAVSF